MELKKENLKLHLQTQEGNGTFQKAYGSYKYDDVISINNIKIFQKQNGDLYMIIAGFYKTVDGKYKLRNSDIYISQESNFKSDLERIVMDAYEELTKNSEKDLQQAMEDVFGE